MESLGLTATTTGLITRQNTHLLVLDTQQQYFLHNRQPWHLSSYPRLFTGILLQIPRVERNLAPTLERTPCMVMIRQGWCAVPQCRAWRSVVVVAVG